MCRPLESRCPHTRPALKWNGRQFCAEIVKNIHVENIPRDSSTVGKNRANTVESRSINEISFVAFPRFPLVPKLLTI